jgi:hypothetical protein
VGFDASVPGLFLMWHDEKFLRDVQRTLATSERMESGWAGTLHALLALATTELCVRSFWCADIPE